MAEDASHDPHAVWLAAPGRIGWVILAHAGFSQSTPPADCAEPRPSPGLPRVAGDAAKVRGPLRLPFLRPAVCLPRQPAASWFIPGPNPALVPGGVYQENGVLGPPGQWIGWFANVERA